MALYLVATPIGNLEDITFRAIRTLKESDIILAEDTRRTRGLLTHFEIEGKRLEAYHAHNEHQKTDWVLNLLNEGKNIALVTDAGMPSIADPGFFLARAAVEAGIQPVIIPGVSALTFAATACAFPLSEFRFVGFPPVKSGRRGIFLQDLADNPTTTIFYESPHRIEKMIKELATVLQPQRKVAFIREATKTHEEVIRGTAQEVLEKTQNRVLKGEFTVVVGPLVSDTDTRKEDTIS